MTKRKLVNLLLFRKMQTENESSLRDVNFVKRMDLVHFFGGGGGGGVFGV